MRFLIGMLTLILLMCGAARAETAQELFMQANTPWQETMEAYGRQIVIDVTPQMPDVDALGIYRAKTVSAQETWGEYIYREQPRKKRGIAYRSKPDEVLAAQEIDETYHAYGNPVSAGEALADVQAFLAALLEDVQEVGISLDTMTVESPKFVYEKNTGAWRGQVYPDETGGYSFQASFWLKGVRMGRTAYPQWRDDRHLDFSMQMPRSTPWRSYLRMGENGQQHFDISLPSVTTVTAEEIALAPLEATKESLRALVGQGLLRSIKRMELAYVGFDCGEEDVWELRPVWLTDAEIYYDETKSVLDYGEPWYETVITDARTGEIIQLCWADGCAPQPDAQKE